MLMMIVVLRGQNGGLQVQLEETLSKNKSLEDLIRSRQPTIIRQGGAKTTTGTGRSVEAGKCQNLSYFDCQARGKFQGGRNYYLQNHYQVLPDEEIENSKYEILSRREQDEVLYIHPQKRTRHL